jgi:hypothetical protein
VLDVVTSGVGVGKVLGKCKPNDALVFKKSGDYGVLVPGSGGGIVALEENTDDTPAKLMRVRFGGGGSSGVAFVRVSAPTSITLSGTQTVDGIALSDGDKVAAWGQGDHTTNGIYTVSATGAWTQAQKFVLTSPVLIVVGEGALAGGTMLFVSADDALSTMGAYFK